MDEPLGALDVKLREAMQVEIRNIQRTLGITAIFVTHDQSEAMSLSDRIVVMNHGRVMQTGTGRELYDHPASHFVADFFGRVNFLPVEVSRVSHLVVKFILLGRTLHMRTAAAMCGDATLALRPEQLRLLPPEGSAEGRNTLPGRVVQTQFLGNMLLCQVALTDALQVLVETRPDDPLAVPGVAVQVAWEPTQGALFAEHARRDDRHAEGGI